MKPPQLVRQRKKGEINRSFATRIDLTSRIFSAFHLPSWHLSAGPHPSQFCESPKCPGRQCRLTLAFWSIVRFRWVWQPSSRVTGDKHLAETPIGSWSSERGELNPAKCGVEISDRCTPFHQPQGRLTRTGVSPLKGPGHPRLLQRRPGTNPFVVASLTLALPPPTMSLSASWLRPWRPAGFWCGATHDHWRDLPN